MLMRTEAFWKPGAGAAAGILLASEAFAPKNTATTDWTTAHTFAAIDNLLIVGLCHEQNRTAAVVLDPSGANIPLTQICTIDGLDGQNNVRFFGVYDFAAQTGAKNVVPTFGAAASGSIGIWTFSGATRLPTTGDFDVQGDSGATTGRSLSLPIGSGEEVGYVLAGCSKNDIDGITWGGATEQHENAGASGGHVAGFARADPTLSDPTAITTTHVNERNAAAAVLCV